MEMEFVKYESTPNERFLGLATIRLMGKIVIRLKVVTTKTGGFFITPASFKMTCGEGQYIPSFFLDSRTDDELLQDFVRKNVKPFLPDRFKDAPAIQQSKEPASEECPF
jgi:hypothetical protein